MKRTLLLFFSFLFCLLHAKAQVFDPYVKTIQLYKVGDQTSFPVMNLGDLNSLELDFDDLDNRIKNYYYTFELCNADWSPSILHSFEYIKGFQNNRITNYRNSSIALTRYVHYQATLPDRNCYPSMSGNYLLKVFLDNDTSKLVFVKKMVIVGNGGAVAAQIQQPFNATYYQKAQKLRIVVQTDNRVQPISPNDVKVVVLQNNNWRTSLFLDKPTIYRGNYFEYNDEPATVMPAGKEFRWLDMRSLRLMSDRMSAINSGHDSTFVFMKPDPTRTNQPYIYYRDLDGSYTIESLDDINPFWQGDYAYVHFTYVPPGNQAFGGRDVYMFGEMTDYAEDTSGKMNFNSQTGVYEKTLFLKQGYYNYNYVTLPYNGQGYPDWSQTEGDNYETENNYLIFVYYRPFGARADQVIGYTSVNTLLQR